MSKVAVVILNWNGKHYLERFLHLLIKRTQIKDVEIVIADNCSTDGSQKWIKETHPEIRLIEFDNNYGFTGGYNRALEQIEADYFLLLNSDVEVTPGWIQPLIAALDNNPQIGICMPKIKSAFERDYFEYAGACGGYLDYFGYPFCRGRILSFIEKDTAQYNQEREIFWASGAAFMIRASLYRSLGGFDDTFFAHMEEIDLCWRAKLSGSQVWAFPDSVVYHVGGGTLPNNSPLKLYYNYRNNLLMLYKNLPGNRLHFTIRFADDSRWPICHNVPASRKAIIFQSRHQRSQPLLGYEKADNPGRNPLQPQNHLNLQRQHCLLLLPVADEAQIHRHRSAYQITPLGLFCKAL
ncbi:hypothetical protein MASR2M69_14270 [Bacteroidota bacterium]